MPVWSLVDQDTLGTEAIGFGRHEADAAHDIIHSTAPKSRRERFAAISRYPSRG